VNCVRCDQPLQKARAGISIFVAGDEYVYSYFWCDACGVYSVEGYHDRFMGDSEVFALPAISREEGDRAVALIGACPVPHDKLCDCASHRALYTGRVGPAA
jgi:hypothetical protein